MAVAAAALGAVKLLVHQLIQAHHLTDSSKRLLLFSWKLGLVRLYNLTKVSQPGKWNW